MKSKLTPTIALLVHGDFFLLLVKPRFAVMVALFVCLPPVFSAAGGKPATAPPAAMVLIPAGEFTMGASGGPDASRCGAAEPVADALPAHRVRLRAFWMERDVVTNKQFARFVAATAYVSVAERPLRPEDFPNAPASALVPGALVFTPPPAAVPLTDPAAWRRYQPGANWRHPTGPQKSLAAQDD